MPLSEYKESIGGGLKLKGVKDARVKKQKKKGRKEENEKSQPDQIATVELESSSSSSRSKDVIAKSDEVTEEEAIPEHGSSNKYGKTDAQVRYEERRRQMQAEQRAKSGSKTHKEKVEELNKYLSRLSEHHDMPRIGPG